MRPEQPKITRSRDSLGGRLGNRVLLLGRPARIESIEQAVDLVLGETEQIESDAVLLEPFQLGREQFVIPAGVERDAIVGKAKCARLSVRQVPEPNDRDLLQSKALGREDSTMTGDQNAALVDQARDIEAEFRNRAGNLGDLLVGVGPGVRCIRQQSIDRPELDLQRITRRRELRPRAGARLLRRFFLRHRVSLADRERACATGGAPHQHIRGQARLLARGGGFVPRR